MSKVVRAYCIHNQQHKYVMMCLSSTKALMNFSFYDYILGCESEGYDHKMEVMIGVKFFVTVIIINI